MKSYIENNKHLKTYTATYNSKGKDPVANFKLGNKNNKKQSKK